MYLDILRRPVFVSTSHYKLHCAFNQRVDVVYVIYLVLNFQNKLIRKRSIECP